VKAPLCLCICDNARAQSKLGTETCRLKKSNIRSIIIRVAGMMSAFVLFYSKNQMERFLRNPLLRCSLVSINLNALHVDLWRRTLLAQKALIIYPPRMAQQSWLGLGFESPGRQLRPLVIARKISFGSQSEQGLKTHEVLMSVLHTLGQRTENGFDTFTRALDALAINPARNPYQLLFNSF